jgi:hypothetical protein
MLIFPGVSPTSLACVTLLSLASITLLSLPFLTLLSVITTLSCSCLLLNLFTGGTRVILYESDSKELESFALSSQI